MSNEYMLGAEPLYLSGSRTGVLLLHGAGGGTAWDFRDFATLLHGRTRMTVWLPTLAGFGTKPEDLIGIRFDDWLSDADRGVEKLLEVCDSIVVVGHSVGGLMALLLASERETIEKVVTWSTPVGVQYRLLRMLPVIRRIPLVKRIIPERIPVPVPEEVRQQGWVGYDWIPPAVGLAVVDGLKRLKRALGKVTCPVFVIQGSADTTVSRDSAKRIYDGIASEKKELWIVDGADHPIMNDMRCRDELFRRTWDFLLSGSTS
jgi:carboxylesterase